MSNVPKTPLRMPLYNGYLTKSNLSRGEIAYDATQFKHWYQTKWWRKTRKMWLATNPLCVMCANHGTVKAANVVDHKVPHRGNRYLFFNIHNLQSLCYHHHNSTKAARERSVSGAHLDGSPLVPADGW